MDKGTTSEGLQLYEVLLLELCLEERRDERLVISGEFHIFFTDLQELCLA